MDSRVASKTSAAAKGMQRDAGSHTVNKPMVK